MPNRVVVNRISQDDIVSELTFSADTSQYASGDLIADTQELAGVAAENGGMITLESLVIIDKDDQGAALFVVFLEDTTSMGSENSAPNISDANAADKVLGVVALATTDYIDIGGAKVGFKNDIGLRMKTLSSSSAIGVALLNETGTPTYTASGLVGKFSFRRS